MSAATYMMQNVYSVRPFVGFPIMHHVGHQVVSGVLLRDLSFFRQILAQVYVPVQLASKHIIYNEDQISGFISGAAVNQDASSLLPQAGGVRNELLRDGEIDNSWVLLHEEVVLGESFDAKDEVRRQFGELEPFQEILFVGFVFLSADATKPSRIFPLLLTRICQTLLKGEGGATNLLCAAIELVEDVEERNLRDDELLLLVLVQRGGRQVEGQKQEGGLGHLLLILLGHQQGLLLFWRLQVDRRRFCLLLLSTQKLS